LEDLEAKLELMVLVSVFGDHEDGGYVVHFEVDFGACGNLGWEEYIAIFVFSEVAYDIYLHILYSIESEF